MSTATDGGLPGRSAEKLLELPLKFRWEFTRRHPCYLTCWQTARAYRRGELQGEEQVTRGWLAFLLLGHIGVTGEPVDPATSAEDLERDGVAESAFLPGPVQPMTYRTMASHMIAALPPAELQALGALLMTAGDPELATDDAGAPLEIQRQRAIARLGGMPSAALDSHFDGPLYYIHLAASQRAITRSLERHVQWWKSRRNLGETRLHTGKLDAYLAAWDQREGWTGAGYAVDNARTFEQISRDVRTSKTTLINQYREAFRWIVGHDYTIERWAALFPPILYPDKTRDPTALHLRRMKRLIESAGSAAVPETTLRTGDGEEHGAGPVESLSAIDDPRDIIDTLIDLKDLLERGLSTQEISQQLELSEPLVEDLRLRLGE